MNEITDYGFKGIVDSKEIEFATEDEYYEYLKENELPSREKQINEFINTIRLQSKNIMSI